MAGANLTNKTYTEMLVFGASCLLHMVLLCQLTIEEMGDSNIKLYYSDLTGNPTIKGYQKYIIQTLTERRVPFEQIDISSPSNEMENQFMRENAIKPDTGSVFPLPPQLFNGNEYLGDYDDFANAVEDGQINVFLKLETKTEITSTGGYRNRVLQEEEVLLGTFEEDSKPEEKTEHSTDAKIDNDTQDSTAKKEDEKHDSKEIQDEQKVSKDEQKSEKKGKSSLKKVKIKNRWT